MFRESRAFAIAGLAAALSLPAACVSSRGVTVEAPVELIVAPVGRLADAGAGAAGDQAEAECALELTAERIRKSSSACFLDEQISEGPGILHYPCDGDGDADAEFGEHRYVGRMSDGELRLEFTTVLDWEDGCRWGTRAIITGTVNGPEWGGELTWEYADHVIDGSDCSGQCTAHTVLTLSELKRPPARMRKHDDFDDEDDD